MIGNFRSEPQFSPKEYASRPFPFKLKLSLFPGDNAAHNNKLVARGKAPRKLLPDSMYHSKITRGEKLNQLGAGDGAGPLIPNPNSKSSNRNGPSGGRSERLPRLVEKAAPLSF